MVNLALHRKHVGTNSESLILDSQRRTWALQVPQVPMDGTTSEATPSVQYLNIVVDQQQLSLATVSTLQQSSSESPSPSPSSASTSLLASASSFERPSQRHCFGDSTPGEFPLAAKPSIVLHVLTHCNLDPKDLVGLEV